MHQSAYLMGLIIAAIIHQIRQAFCTLANRARILLPTF